MMAMSKLSSIMELKIKKVRKYSGAATKPQLPADASHAGSVTMASCITPL